MSFQREIRFLQATEVRAMGGSGDADPLRIEGYASVFNSVAKLPGFREKIQQGAFTRAIEQHQDVVCLFNHDQNVVLGRTTSGTLLLNQDERGLHYVCNLPNTQTARDIHESIRRGDINGCSFAFQVNEGGQSWSEERDTDGTYYVMRAISDVNLIDVSPVTHPCYNGTEVYTRSEELVPVELRSAVDLKNQIEARIYGDGKDAPDYVPADKKAQWKEVWNSAYKKAKAEGSSDEDAEKSAFKQANGVAGPNSDKKSEDVPAEQREEVIAPPVAEQREEDDTLDEDEFDRAYVGRSYRDGNEHAEHEDMGMCEAPDCICQNRFAPTGSGYRSDDYIGREIEVFIGADVPEARGGMTRTKRVSGKDLSSKSFAYVGDPNRTETWKFPIHDAAHVRNALARWGQAKGIPENKKAGVLAKIKAAAKRFGIKVSDDGRSWSLSAEERKSAAQRLNAAMRYSPDQPRDDNGRFGESGTGENAKGAAEHSQAAKDHAQAASMHRQAAAEHAQAAKDAAKSGNVEKEKANDTAEMAHLHAATMHSAASMAHTGYVVTGQNEWKTNNLSRTANNASKMANRLSDKT